MNLTQTPAAAATAEARPAGAARPAIASDFDTFLRLLTTQLKNQDPLNPMESSEFAVQLATFSGVEQQVTTNRLLERMLGQGGAAQLNALGGWIGREVRAVAPAAFDGRPLTLDLAPAPLADAAVLVVLDESGREVRRQPVAVEAGPLAWSGDGAVAPGTYRFRLESLQDGALLTSADVAVYAPVTEARIGADGAATLILRGGIAVAADSVTALRDPPS
jgi:flagellar basal-body rod modification protein FlgD